jgi:hypothetical protein
MKESRPLQQPARSWSEAEVTFSGVQQDDPLNGASVQFRFGLPEGWIVKLFGPFEAEVLRSISKLNAASRLGVRGRVESETEAGRWGD